MQSALSKPPEIVRWSKEFYYQMRDLGWFGDKKVELIDGEIYEMSPIGSHHAVAVMLVTQAINAILPSNFCLSVQNPISSGNFSEPVPDVSVLEGSIRDYTERLPATASLVVKVADSSLEYDSALKAELYARAGIPEYWIVDLNNNVVIVHQSPLPDKGEYNLVQRLSLDENMQPLFAPTEKFLASTLLP